MIELLVGLTSDGLTEWWEAIDPILDDPLILGIITAICAAIGLPVGLGIKNKAQKNKLNTQKWKQN